MRTDSTSTSPTISDDRHGPHRFFSFGHHSTTRSNTTASHVYRTRSADEDVVHSSSSHHTQLFSFSHLQSHSQTDSVVSSSITPENSNSHETQPPGEEFLPRFFGFGHLHSTTRTESVRSSPPGSGDQPHHVPSTMRTDSIQTSPPEFKGAHDSYLPSERTESLRSASPGSDSPTHYTPSITRTESILSSPTECGSLNQPLPSTPRESLCSSPTSTSASTLHPRNVLIVGDVGVGKSSLINLISGQRVATTSSGAKSCTLQSHTYPVMVNDVAFSLHDTAGLHEAQGNMGKKEYLDAVHQAYALISRLERSGGISLLVFCMKGGRVSITMQQTYNLFVEVFCNRQVPVVIVVTHLEMYDSMEQWWSENEKAIREYGLRSHGHACITTTRGYQEIFSHKYEQSKGVMRKLLLDYSGRVAWKEERASWVKRVVVHMRNWLSPRRAKQLNSGDLRRKLTRRCGFSPEDADLVAEKIEESRGINTPVSWFDEKHGNDSNISLSVVSCAS